MITRSHTPSSRTARANRGQKSTTSIASLSSSSSPRCQQQQQRRRRRTATACSAETDERSKIPVRFSVNYRCDFGQHLAIVGSHVGEWQPERAAPLAWGEGDWWSGEVELPLPSPPPPSSSPSSSSSKQTDERSGSGSGVEYKYIVRNGDGNAACWQPNDNFSLAASVSAPPSRLPSRLEVEDSWDGRVHDVVEISPPSSPPPTPVLTPSEAAGELRAALSDAVSALDERRISPASVEALEADARVAAAAAAATASAAAAAAASKRQSGRFLRE